MTTVYVREQGAVVRKRGERLVITKEDRELGGIPLVNLTQVARYERDGDEHTRLFVQGAPEAVPASRERWGELRRRLEEIRPAP